MCKIYTPIIADYKRKHKVTDKDLFPIAPSEIQIQPIEKHCFEKFVQRKMVSLHPPFSPPDRSVDNLWRRQKSRANGEQSYICQNYSQKFCQREKVSATFSKAAESKDSVYVVPCKERNTPVSQKIRRREKCSVDISGGENPIQAVPGKTIFLLLVHFAIAGYLF